MVLFDIPGDLEVSQYLVSAESSHLIHYMSCLFPVMFIDGVGKNKKTCIGND